MISLFDRLFGDNLSHSSSEAKEARKKRKKRRRVCRIEELEGREMLSATPFEICTEAHVSDCALVRYDTDSMSVSSAVLTQAEFNTISSQYANLYLTDYGDYNIIVVGGSSEFAFSEEGLRTAISTAVGTPGKNLVVVRTDSVQNTITLTRSISVLMGSSHTVNIVSFGDEPLTLDGNNVTRVFHIHEGAIIALGGVHITNGHANGANGGAILNAGRLTLVNCMIYGNTATLSGGAISNTSEGGLIVAHSIIAGNNADWRGGAIFNEHGAHPLVITNSVISGNRAFEGGAIYNNNEYVWHGSTLTVVNSTIAGNQTTGTGGAVHVAAAVSTFHNNIVAQNIGGTDIFDVGTVVAWYNLIGNGDNVIQSSHGRQGNIIGTALNPADPMFVSFTSYTAWNAELWKSWDLRLASESLAIDAGATTFAVDVLGNPLQLDMNGNPRVFNGIVDMGAYEYVLAAPTGFRVITATPYEMLLEWDVVTDATGYQVEYRIEGSHGIWLTSDVSVINTTAVVSGLAPNTQYEFRVRAVNARFESDWSELLSALTLPAQPTGFRVEGTPVVPSVVLAWDLPENSQSLTGYTLHRSISGADTWETVYSPASDATQATVATSPGIYDFRLIANNASGESVAALITGVRVVPEPVQPQGFRVTVQDANFITLAWDAQEWLDSYTLEYRVVGDVDWQTYSPSPGIDSTGATVSGLEPNIYYEFQLTATNVAGEAASSIIHLTLLITNLLI